MPDSWRLAGDLQEHSGRLTRPPTRGPFELALYEDIAYLVSDGRREKAFQELKSRIVVRPEDLLLASTADLAEIAAIGGIFPKLRAGRLEEAARLARDKFGGDLGRVLALDFAAARRALERFPAIGEPGAEKILLFTGAHPCLALESNGARVWVRFGFAREHKSYATAYRALEKALPRMPATNALLWLRRISF